MKKYLIIGLALAVAGMITTIVVQYRLIQQEHTKQVAIKNPAKTKAEVVTRVIIKKVDAKGDPVVEIKEVIRTVVVQKPEIPTDGRERSLYYIGGSIHTGIKGSFAPEIYGVSAGINLTESLSVGIVYQRRAEGQNYVGISGRINF